MPQPKLTAQFCAYCGGPGGTRDHVFPRAIFTRPFPPNLPTVPACRPCQDRKGEGEGDLRDLLAGHYASSAHPNAKGLMAALGRALPRNQSQLSHTFDQGHRIQQPSASELALPDLWAAPFDFSRVYVTMEMVVRGLYFDQTGFRLAPDSRMELALLPERDRAAWLQDFRDRIPDGAWREIGDGIVRWMSAFDVEPGSEPSDSIWIIVFHGGFGWIAQTGHGAERARELRANGQARIDAEATQRERLDRLNLVTAPVWPENL